MTAGRGDEIELRPAAASDAAAVAEVYLSAFHATYDFALVHTGDQVRAWIRDVLIPAGDTWVATVGGAIVAMAVIRPGDLDQLYVAPAAQGRGIGSRLVDLAKRRSPQGLGLYTFQVNARARRFYERHGFVADAFGDGSGNEEGQPDVHYRWQPGRRPVVTELRPAYPLRTERLTLRPWAETDLEALLDLYGRPEVTRYVPWDALDRPAAEAFLARRLTHPEISADSNRLFVAASLDASDRVIGEFMLKVSDAENRQGEIGWGLHPDVQGRGLATEGAREMLRLGFEEVRLHRIVADADPRNGASLRVMERLGMRPEAELRESSYLKGEWVGAAIWAILEDEWRGRRA